MSSWSGAGSSGGVLAARLSEDPACRVLLLEAGPDFPDEAERLPLFAVSGEHSWLVAGLPEFDWDFADRDRAGRRGGRPIRLLRGRLVGGSSMVNSTIAARPAPFDLDRWAGLGCPGWDWPCHAARSCAGSRPTSISATIRSMAPTGRSSSSATGRPRWAPVNRVVRRGLRRPWRAPRARPQRGRRASRRLRADAAQPLQGGAAGHARDLPAGCPRTPQPDDPARARWSIASCCAATERWASLDRR